MRDPWADIRKARLAREAAESAEAARLDKERRDAERDAQVAIFAEALTKPGPAGEPGAPGLPGPQGIPGPRAPKPVRTELERDWVQVIGPASGEAFWAEMVVGATIYFDDGSTEHSTVIRDAKGRPESVIAG